MHVPQLYSHNLSSIECLIAFIPATTFLPLVTHIYIYIHYSGDSASYCTIAIVYQGLRCCVAKL